MRTALEDWNTKLENRNRTWFDNITERYDSLCDIASGLTYSPADVTDFSFALAKYEQEDMFLDFSGVFLSALVEKGREDAGERYIVYTKDLPFPIWHLGYMNRKSIVIMGDVGWYLGIHMKGGDIVVQGNALHTVGYGMSGGRITVEGNAVNSVGMCMRGGKIIVMGNSGESVGKDMAAGKIIVKGDTGGCAGERMENGEIVIYGNAGNSVGDGMIGGKIHLHGGYGCISEDYYGITHGIIYHKGKRI